MSDRKYSEEEMAAAIEDLIELCQHSLGRELDKLREKHPVIDEIFMFSKNGPVGIGLGKFGGHVV